MQLDRMRSSMLLDVDMLSERIREGAEGRDTSNAEDLGTFLACVLRCRWTYACGWQRDCFELINACCGSGGACQGDNGAPAWYVASYSLRDCAVQIRDDKACRCIRGDGRLL